MHRLRSLRPSLTSFVATMPGLPPWALAPSTTCPASFPPTSSMASIPPSGCAVCSTRWDHFCLSGYSSSEGFHEDPRACPARLWSVHRRRARPIRWPGGVAPDLRAQRGRQIVGFAGAAASTFRDPRAVVRQLHPSLLEDANRADLASG